MVPLVSFYVVLGNWERDRNLICIKRFRSPAPARMTRVEKSLVQAHFQFSHLLPRYYKRLRHYIMSQPQSHFRVDILFYRPVNPVFGSLFLFIGLQISFSGRYLFLSAWKSRFRVDNFIYRPANPVFGSIIYFIGLVISFSGRYLFLSACKSHFRADIFIYRPANLIFGSIFIFIGLVILFSGR